MKKANFILLQIVLAAILIGLGVLVELKGENSNPGTATVFLVCPGTAILVSLVAELIKFKVIWQRIIAIIAVCLVLDIAAFIYFKITFTSIKAFLLLAVVLIIGVAIGFLFHMIYYYSNKKPGH